MHAFTTRRYSELPDNRRGQPYYLGRAKQRGEQRRAIADGQDRVYGAAIPAPMLDDVEFGGREPVGKAQRDHHDETRDRAQQTEKARQPAAAAPPHPGMRFEIAHPILQIIASTHGLPSPHFGCAAFHASHDPLPTDPPRPARRNPPPPPPPPPP